MSELLCLQNFPTPVSHPWYSPASLPDGSGCWIRLITMCVLRQKASHLLLIRTNSGYGTLLTAACVRQGCSAGDYYCSIYLLLLSFVIKAGYHRRFPKPAFHSETSCVDFEMFIRTSLMLHFLLASDIWYSCCNIFEVYNSVCLWEIEKRHSKFYTIRYYSPHFPIFSSTTGLCNLYTFVKQ
jgi:hypothetical protein